MNIKNGQDRKSFFSVALLALAIVLLGGTAMQLIKIVGANYEDTDLTEEALAQIRPDVEKTQEYLQAYKTAAADLTENNMFVPKSDESEAPGDCTAIFGDEARIGNRWYQAGDRVGDARIESIEPTVVTLLFNNERITRKPVLVAESNSRNSRNQSQNNQRGRGQRGNARGGRGGDRGGNIDQARRQEIADRAQVFMESEAGQRISTFMGDNGRNMITNFMSASPEQRQVQLDQFRQQFQGGTFEFRTSTSSGGPGGQADQQTIIIRQD